MKNYKKKHVNFFKIKTRFFIFKNKKYIKITTNFHTKIKTIIYTNHLIFYIYDNLIVEY